MSIRIALAGNPNSGKTTLFNSLTGSNQYVGNWPGVTVEKKEGRLKKYDDVIVTDLPGIYSLSPYTLEEVVARDYLVEEKPDAVLNIVDGTSLERNLYLTTQILELGVPVVVAINMMDVVRKSGNKIDINELSKQLGVPVVEISALKETGIEEATEIVINAAKSKKAPPIHHYSGVVEHALAHIEEAAVHDMPEHQQRWYAIKIFESDKRVVEQLQLTDEKLAHIKNDIKLAEFELDDDAESIIINERYNHIEGFIKNSYKRAKIGRLSSSDKIDKIVTSRIFGLPIFAAVMFIVYYVSMRSIGSIATDWVNDVLLGEMVPSFFHNVLNALNCADWLHSLIVDGVIAGVGAVLGFVPQLMVLFIFLAFLEGCGYMSRVAFVLDRIFRNFGLSGKSFIPMLIGTGCGVPGIMASRTIENKSDRRMTVITTTFIPCSAKIPVIGLVAGALFGGSPFIAASAYFIGVIAIIASGVMLKKTKLFAGEASPFVMELPAYRLPTVQNVLRSMWERSWSFIKKAGTVIALSSMVIWFLQSFGVENGGFGMVDNTENSILAYIGNAFAWVFTPIGWGGWKTAVASVTGLVAKENLVSTFGILYNCAGELSENGDEIWTAFAQNLNELSGGHSALAGYSYLVFNLLCAPCFAAVGAIRREMNSPKWTLFAIGYQCGFAYLVSLMIYQFGRLFAGDPDVFGLIAAVITLIFFIYMLARKNKYAQNGSALAGKGNKS